MFQRQNQRLILDRISAVLDATAETHTDALTARLDEADRIFITGAGRSKLVGNFLAMRLMHAGYDVSVVGEIVTPAIGPVICWSQYPAREKRSSSSPSQSEPVLSEPKSC